MNYRTTNFVVNTSKIIAVSVLIFTVVACGGLRKANDTSGSPFGKKKDDSSIKKPNPSAGPVVDTIQWKVDPSARPPIVTTTPSSGGTVIIDGTTGGVSTPASAYNITLLLPFFTDKFSEAATSNYSKSQFALDFYAGTRIALDSLSTTPIRLNVNVLDSRTDLKTLLTRSEITNTDVIIGPVEKDLVATFIDYSVQNNKTVISPYYPSSDIVGAHPNFIQVKPSLKTHCENIMRDVRAKYQTNQVVVVGRIADNENARFSYFQEANTAINQSYAGGRLDEWAIEDETNFNVESYLRTTGTTVVIVPSWNEPFVALLLKKLNASSKKNNIVVYGMPQWLDFDKSLNNLFAALNVTLSSSTHIDANNPEVRHFRNKYLAKFNKIPSTDSYLGYDCAIYFVSLMARYGTKISPFLAGEARPVLHTQFRFEPVAPKIVNDNDFGDNTTKYENKHVNMLRFQNGSFKLAE